jgi:glutamate-1-semialdehyde aminotransferase
MPNRVGHNADYPSIAQSNAIWERAVDLIPAGTQTLAKGPGQWVDGVAPKYLRRGSGCRVWDVDGNEYLDFQMGVGPLSLGYAYPAVDEAIRAQLADGITFSLMHPLEVEVAERIRALVPGAEMVRFSKTGCDVTTAAVRLARAFTGRRKVLCCGYHGWHDWYIGVTDRNRGIPADVQALTYTFAYNDLGSVLDGIDDDTACLILEPVVFEEPKNGFLRELRRVCTERGVVLVFDEMWTGFRLALGGCQAHYDVRADLACFSKAVANGMPLSVLTGRRDIMRLCEKDVFFFTTFGGEALSLAAAKATLGELEARKVPEALDRHGRALRQGLLAAASGAGIDWLGCVGLDCRTLVTFDPKAGNPLELRSLLQQELVKRGILWSGFHNLSYAHGEAEVELLLQAYREVLPTLAEAASRGEVAARLRGRPVEPVFRKTSHFNSKPRDAARTE